MAGKKKKAPLPVSGPFYDGLTWEYDEAAGRITISGDKDIPDDTCFDRFDEQAQWVWTNHNVRELVIGGGVSYIGKMAFYGIDIPRIVLEEGVDEIGVSAFATAGVKELVLPDSLTWIGGSAFQENPGLIELTLPRSGLYIGEQAFAFTGLEKVTFPDAPFEIGEYAFRNTGLKELSLPDCIDFLSEGAFHCCALEEVRLPDDTEYIPPDCFSGCGSLRRIVLPEGTDCIGANAFRDCAALEEIVLPANVTEIGTHAFSGCTALRVCRAGSVQRIGTGAFEGCPGLREKPKAEDMVTEGSLLLSKDRKTVLGCVDGLSGVLTIPEGITAIASGAFADCRNLTEIVLPEGITAIGGTAFRGCESILSLTLPDSLTSIDQATFLESAIERCIVRESHPRFSCDDGVLYSKDRKTLLFCPPCREAAVVVPEGVTAIEESAFLSCEYLAEVELPESLTEIGESAFEGCGNLGYIKIPAGITSIGENAFSCCSELSADYAGTKEQWDAVEKDEETEFDLFGEDGFHEDSAPEPEEQATEGDCGADVRWSFDEAEGRLTISGTGPMEDYDEYTRYSMPWAGLRDRIRSVIIEPGVTTVGDHAFYFCGALEEIRIPEGVTRFGIRAFHGCEILAEIPVPSTVTLLCQSVCVNCLALRTFRYAGTRAQWDAVKIKYQNTRLNSVDVICEG